jgi:hypothetical protein
MLAILAPFGVWIAGCRRETQSARMPGGPETARLARAPGSSIGDAPLQPHIPARIDPEVMLSPDRNFRDRVQAMADREAAISNRHYEAGLYVLPNWQTPIAPQGESQTPGRIWSRPVSGEDSMELVPLQFQPIVTDPVINQLMTMAPGSPYPNLDPNMPLGDPTLIPGMFFGPGDLALLGALRVRNDSPSVARGTGGLTLPPSLSSNAFDNIALGALRLAEPKNDQPLPRNPTNIRQDGEMPDTPTEPAQRQTVIKLKPVGEGDIQDKESAPTSDATVERELVDSQLECDLLALPGPPAMESNAEPFEKSAAAETASSPLALDLEGLMASSAWEQENAASLPAEASASTAGPISPVAGEPAPPAVEAPIAVVENIRKHDPRVPELIELKDLRFSEIAPPSLPTMDVFAEAPETEKGKATGDSGKSGSSTDMVVEKSEANEAGIASWLENADAHRDAKHADRSIQPLSGVDFSLYDWEMKTVPQKLKLTPTKIRANGGTEGKRNIEPEAPPLVDMQ